jgi:hypothetical protein
MSHSPVLPSLASMMYFLIAEPPSSFGGFQRRVRESVVTLLALILPAGLPGLTVNNYKKN